LHAAVVNFQLGRQYKATQAYEDKAALGNYIG